VSQAGRPNVSTEGVAACAARGIMLRTMGL
jgi:hypothetical protein